MIPLAVARTCQTFYYWHIEFTQDWWGAYLEPFLFSLRYTGCP